MIVRGKLILLWEESICWTRIHLFKIISKLILKRAQFCALTKQNQLYNYHRFFI